MFEKFQTHEAMANDIIYHIPYVYRDVPAISDGIFREPVPTISRFEFNVSQFRGAINEQIALIEGAGYQAKWLIINERIHYFIRLQLQGNNSHFDCTGFVLTPEMNYYGVKILSSEALPMEGFIVA